MEGRWRWRWRFSRRGKKSGEEKWPTVKFDEVEHVTRLHDGDAILISKCVFTCMYTCTLWCRFIIRPANCTSLRITITRWINYYTKKRHLLVRERNGPEESRCPFDVQCCARRQCRVVCFPARGTGGGSTTSLLLLHINDEPISKSGWSFGHGTADAQCGAVAFGRPG